MPHYDDDTLLKYLHEMLPEEKQQEVETHLEVCPDRSCHESLEWLYRPFPELPARYQLLGKEGSGGMGLVLRVRDLMFNRDLAIKTLQQQLGIDYPGLQRFQEEAHITAQLQHPGVPPVHEVGQLADGRPFFAMKLVKGETLAKKLSSRSMPGENLGMFLRYFEQICEAVAYAHDRRIIHRDLKPLNVMVGAHGEVQVMDWGVAKKLPRDASPKAEESTATEAKTVVDPPPRREGQETKGALGTYSYMAPEQALARVYLQNERSDVFSLGAILCEILTGQPPYTGSGKEQIREQAEDAKLDEAYRRLDESGINKDLVNLAKSCLHRDQGKRPENATAVWQETRNYLKSEQDREQKAQLKAAEEAARAEAEKARADAEEREKIIAQKAAAAAKGKARMRLWAIALTGVLAALAVAWTIQAQLSAARERALRQSAMDALANLAPSSARRGVSVAFRQELIDLARPLLKEVKDAEQSAEAVPLELALECAQGAIYRDQQHFAKAEPVLRNVLSRLPELAQDRRLRFRIIAEAELVLLLVSAGNLDQALADYDQLLLAAKELLPTEGPRVPFEVTSMYRAIPQAASELGSALEAKERSQDAIKCYDDLMASSETWRFDDLDLTIQLGTILFHRSDTRLLIGDNEAAVNDLENARKLALSWQQKSSEDPRVLTFLWRAQARVAYALHRIDAKKYRNELEVELRKAQNLVACADVEAFPVEYGRMLSVAFFLAPNTFPAAEVLPIVQRLELSAHNQRVDSTLMLATGYGILAFCEYRDGNDSAGDGWYARFQSIRDKIKSYPWTAQQKVIASTSLGRFDPFFFSGRNLTLSRRWAAFETVMNIHGPERWLNRARFLALVFEKKLPGTFLLCKNLSLDMLEAAYLDGFADWQKIESAKELAPLRQETRYRELVTQIKKQESAAIFADLWSAGVQSQIETPWVLAFHSFRLSWLYGTPKHGPD